MNRKNDPENASIIRSLVVGIGASFLVPLFLNMISSNLIDSIRENSNTSGDMSKVLIFAGFCIVAAISSTAFIHTLSDRILAEAKDARKVAERAKAEAIEAKEEILEVQTSIDSIVRKETEEEPFEKASSLGVDDHLSDAEIKVLDAFLQSHYAHRSISGLAQNTGIDRKEISNILSNLVTKGLVGRSTSDNGIRWYITEQGRALLQNA